MRYLAYGTWDPWGCGHLGHGIRVVLDTCNSLTQHGVQVSNIPQVICFKCPKPHGSKVQSFQYPIGPICQVSNTLWEFSRETTQHSVRNHHYATWLNTRCRNLTQELWPIHVPYKIRRNLQIHELNVNFKTWPSINAICKKRYLRKVTLKSFLIMPVIALHWQVIVVFYTVGLCGQSNLEPIPIPLPRSICSCNQCLCHCMPASRYSCLPTFRMDFARPHFMAERTATQGQANEITMTAILCSMHICALDLNPGIKWTELRLTNSYGQDTNYFIGIRVESVFKIRRTRNLK